MSQISAGRKNSLQWEIDGSTSAAAWDSETPDHLWLGHRDRPNEILLRNPALMGPAGRAASALPGGHVEGFGDTFGALSVGGALRAMSDLCVHRGTALSLGWVQGDELVCAYHGWRYGADGRCVAIPQKEDPTAVPVNRRRRVAFAPPSSARGSFGADTNGLLAVRAGHGPMLRTRNGDGQTGARS